MTLTNGDKKKIIGLRQKKYRDQYEEFVAEGYSIIEEALDGEYSVINLIIMGSKATDEKTKHLMSKAARASVPVDVIKDPDFIKLSSLENPQGVLAVIKKKKDYVEVDKPYLIIDSIKDPGNLGTIFRSADWFGFNNIVLGKNSVDIYNPKVVQSSMGSIFRINVSQNIDLFKFISQIKANNYEIIATSLDGDVSSSIKVPRNKFAIMIGNESEGLDPLLLKSATRTYKIPGSGRAESLNVGVAASIVLYQLFTKQ